MLHKDNNLKWVITKSKSKSFPYKLFITKGSNTILSLLLQDKWPGEKGHIFCLKNEEPFSVNNNEIIEEVEINNFKKFGSKISITLKRNTKKRCEFLFLEKKYKNKEGTYTQIFFRTQRGITERKLKNVYIPKVNKKDITITISSNEKYPYNFPSFSVKFGYLPLGDYALEDSLGNLVAIVERKTLNNFCKELSNFDLFIMKLLELQSLPHAALVVEANYSDFFNPRKVGNKISISLIAKLIPQLFAKVNKLPIVFAGNRKMAEYWVTQYFIAISALKNEFKHNIVQEIPIEYYTNNDDIISQILSELKQAPQSVSDLSIKLDIDKEIIRKHLYSLAKRGLIQSTGRGKNAKWQIKM
ncbi:ArsR family transcriptional regulator [Deferribacter thermophilus]|uniref:ArsR family transcriptional regulator n=1 Tax=Deferribacter thermophilus TaxID=53573 RepID=UPI003C26E0C0